MNTLGGEPMKVEQKHPEKAAAMVKGVIEPKSAARTLRATRPGATRLSRANVLELIEEKMRLEGINPEEALIQKVHAHFEPAKLPRAMRVVAAPSKCTTPQLRRLVREVRDRYEKLSPKAKKEISKYIRLKKHGEAYLVEYPGGEE